ncbi:hypothetical protein Tco_0055183, partial [Tanacetum coccineum]
MLPFRCVVLNFGGVTRMMTSIEEVNLRVNYQEVRQAYLRFEAQNKALLARLETLETHMTRIEWQRQRAEDDA